MPALGQYRYRIVILSRVLAAKNASGEEVESWPDPPSGLNEYWAARDTQTAGETITQGLRQTTGSMKLRIKSPGTQGLPIYETDRLRLKTTGVVYAIAGVTREPGETVLDIERVAPPPSLPSRAPRLTIGEPTGTTIPVTIDYPPQAAVVVVTLRTLEGTALSAITLMSPTTNGTFTGLTLETTYRLDARGRNAAGDYGPQSGPVEASTGGAVPATQLQWHGEALLWNGVDLVWST